MSASERVYAVMTAPELDALPVGTVRDFDLAGIYTKCEKEADGTWRIYRRRNIPSKALGRLPSTPYVDQCGRETSHAPAAKQVPVPVPAQVVKRAAAMARVAGAK